MTRIGTGSRSSRGVRRPRWLFRNRVTEARPGTAKPFGIGHLGATVPSASQSPNSVPMSPNAAPAGPNATRLDGA